MRQYDKAFKSNSKVEVVSEPSYKESEDYVDSSYETEFSEVEYMSGVVDNCKAAYIRSAPTKSSKDVSVVNKGDSLKVRNSDDPDWYEVDGFNGYIMKELVSLG